MHNFDVQVADHILSHDIKPCRLSQSQARVYHHTLLTAAGVPQQECLQT